MEFSINLPNELDLDTNPAVTNATCDATPEIFGSTDRLTLTDATIAANSTCTMVMTFTGITLGTFTTTNIFNFNSNETASVSVPNPPQITVK